MRKPSSPQVWGGADKPRLAFGSVLLCALALPAAARAQDVAPPMVAVEGPAPGSVAAITWRKGDVRELLRVIDAAGDEGLDPASYDRAGLKRALEDGEGAALDAAATAAASQLARDYFLGRVQDRTRFDWKIERSPYAAYALNAELAKAVANGQVAGWLRSLLPQDERYAALRSAYADTPESDAAARGRLRANLERLRWLPRDFGQSYVYVNIPSYKLAVVEDGARTRDYTVIVGAPDTPTPMLRLAAQSVVVNPSWSVPQSIIKKKGGAFSAAGGYVVTRTADGGLSVRQKPGDDNSLGRIKIDMPNPDAIYLHDTNARGLFARDERALSHGCVRVKDIDALAEQLMGEDAAPVETALATRDTQTVRLPKQWPVYIVYLTADTDGDGKVVSYGDPYRRDAPLLAALDGRTEIASR